MEKNKRPTIDDYNNEQTEINLSHLFNVFVRNKKFIGLFSSIGVLLLFIFVKTQKKIWQGEFQIVLATQSKPTLNDFSNNQVLSNLIGLELNTSESIKTELEILKSPSVLMPVFDYVKVQASKQSNQNKPFLFKSWLKNNLEFELKKGTSIMVVKYNDDEKELIIPVLERITKTYQNYSGKNRSRKLSLASDYLSSQILKYKKNSSESFKKVQEYAIEQDLLINKNNQITDNDFDEISPTKTFSKITDIERVRVSAANKIRNIDLQIKKIQELGNNVDELQYIGSTIPGLERTGLIDRLENIQNQISSLSAKYTDNDINLRELFKNRIRLIELLKERSIGYLKAERIATEAKMEAAMRPKAVITKYLSLLRESERDEITLFNLENRFNLVKLESARLQDPWELITKPTLLRYPIKPNTKQIFLLGTFVIILFSYLMAYFYEKKKGLIYEPSILEEKLEAKILDEISLDSGLNIFYNKEIVQREILEINTKNTIKIFVSYSLSKNEFKKAINFIFDDESQYEVVDSFINLKKEDKLILIAKFSSITSEEIVSIKKRLDFRDLRFNGIFIFK